MWKEQPVNSLCTNRGWCHVETWKNSTSQVAEMWEILAVEAALKTEQQSQAELNELVCQGWGWILSSVDQGKPRQNLHLTVFWAWALVTWRNLSGEKHEHTKAAAFSTSITHSFRMTCLTSVLITYILEYWVQFFTNKISGHWSPEVVAPSLLSIVETASWTQMTTTTIY